MPRLWKFTLPTQIHFGRGSLRRLDAVTRPLGNRVLLVGYRDAPPLADLYARAARALEKAGLTVAPFLEVDADPSLAVVERGAAACQAADADVLVAIGGGSVLDAAKAIAAAKKGDGSLFRELHPEKELRPLFSPLPLVAVPTTAGTGSEVSHVAVFGFEAPAPGDGDQPALPLKAGVWGDALRPSHAIVDPDLTIGMPPRLTAACALDALGHAIESLLSRQSNPLCAPLAVRAAALVFEALPQALADPAATGPRESLALAATLAGAALSESGVTVAHAMAHALGAVLDVPHAEAVAAAMPVGLLYNAQAAGHATAELAAIARTCGHSGPDAAALGWLADRVAGLCESAGVPQRIAPPDSASPELTARLTASAIRSTPSALALNPRKVDAPALSRLFDEVMQPHKSA